MNNPNIFFLEPEYIVHTSQCKISTQVSSLVSWNWGHLLFFWMEARQVRCTFFFKCVQVWSISYNSWLTLILLVWSCVIWMLKDRRRFAMLSAPFLAVYGTLLLVVTFISQLHLNHIDIFPTLPKLVLIDFDVYGYPVPCVHLAAKVCKPKSCDRA